MFADRYTSPALRKKRRRRAFRLLFFVLLVLSLVAGLFVWLVRLRSVNIEKITVVGNSIEDAEKLRVRVLDGLFGSYFFLVPKTNIFFYPENEIENGLKKDFPRLFIADLSFDGFNALLLEVKERTPNFIWCPAEGNVGCYFADKDGFIFAPAPDFSDNVYVRILGGVKGPPLGQNILLSWTFSELGAFLGFLEEDGLPPTVVEFGESGDVVIHLNGEKKIFVNQKNKLENILNSLESALDSEIFRKSDFKFEYLDLRFDNKIFYNLTR